MTQAQLDAVRELDFEHTTLASESLYPGCCPTCDDNLIDGYCEYCNGPKQEEDVDEFSYEQLRDAYADLRYELRKEDRLMRRRS